MGAIYSCIFLLYKQIKILISWNQEWKKRITGITISESKKSGNHCKSTINNSRRSWSHSYNSETIKSRVSEQIDKRKVILLISYTLTYKINPLINNFLAIKHSKRNSPLNMRIVGNMPPAFDCPLQWNNTLKLLFKKMNMQIVKKVT